MQTSLALLNSRVQRVAKQLHNGLRAARHSSGGDALRRNTRTHPEHDG